MKKTKNKLRIKNNWSRTCNCCVLQCIYCIHLSVYCCYYYSAHYSCILHLHTLRKKGTKAVTGVVPFQNIHFFIFYIQICTLLVLIYTFKGPILTHKCIPFEELPPEWQLCTFPSECTIPHPVWILFTVSCWFLYNAKFCNFMCTFLFQI